MKIVSWNVNGLRSVHNKGLFVPFIEALRPDIVALQETKAQQHESAIQFDDYKEYWNSALKKGYSGTAIFSKIEPVSVELNLSAAITQKYALHADAFGNPNTEGRVITTEYDHFYLVNVYTPNSKGDLARLKLRYEHWDPAFLFHVKQLEKTKPVIFCGDLNVAHTEDDLARPTENEGKHGFTQEEREGLDRVIEAGFVDTFRLFTKGNGHYTWWTHWANARAKNIGWRIDYFFVSASLVPKITSAKIHAAIMGSDHCPISLELDL
ncbi:MAG TPA: exodeoxyribonuclease III [Candidatus Paceibacterota bacterium]|nr:exodeoxyribonuclease III [Candidatus Paceibacterota bacterium]